MLISRLFCPALALDLLTTANYSVQFLYAERALRWNMNQLSYHRLFIGTPHALDLVLILHYLMKV